MVPNFIRIMLRSRWLFFVGAAALTYMYWWSGLVKLFDFTGAQAEMAHFGLNPSAFYAALTVFVQLAGSALIIFGRRLAWLGAGMLAVFTLATIPVAHPFWTMEGAAAFMEKMVVLEHITVVGGLIVAAILGELLFAGPAQETRSPAA